MAIESAVFLRRVARNACLILFVGLLFSGAAMAQLPIKAPVQVTVGSVIPFGHGSTGQWSQIYAVKVAHNGSVLFLDTALSNLYQWAPGAPAPTLLVGPAPTGQVSNGSTLEAAGTFWNSGMALDANDTLYITDRYGSAVHFLRVPYDKTSGTWIFGSAANWANSPSIVENGTPTAIEPQDVAINCDNGFPCMMYVAWSNTGEIDKLTIDANGNTGTVAPMITGMETNASNIAVDHAGDLFFLESAYSSPSTRVTGVREIPASATLPISGDGKGNVEAALTRVDPASAGFNFKGMTFDAAGNLYLSSENDGNAYGGNVSLVLMVPNEGTPTSPNLVWADAVQVSPVAAGFPVAIDPRGYLWIPNGNGGSNWAPPGTTAPPCRSTDTSTCTTSGMVLWSPGSANLGTSAIGTLGATQTVFYSFSQTTTPASFSYAQPGNKNFTTVTSNPNADPTVDPPVLPCTAGTTYPTFSGQETTASQYSWCAFYVQLNPQTTGNLGGELQALDSSNNIIPGSNAYLGGIGQGASVSVLSPVMTQSVALGLQAPQQVAADSLGNSYVVDSTLGTVEMYPPGQASAVVGTAYGTGLTAPTGVAVDTAGDLFIGDSGKIIEIPFISGALAPKLQTTIQTGLGNHLNLAADSAGNVYVADADNKQVVRVANAQMGLLLENQPRITLGAGISFTGPSAIAADNSGNMYVADGADLWELTPTGGEKKITSSLSAPVTGMAVDPSGSVFVAESTGLVWIPYQISTGGLNVNGAVQVVTTVGNNSTPNSVALDGFENAYVSYGSGTNAGMSQVGVGGALDFGQIVPFLEADQEAQLFNVGNAPLTVSVDPTQDIFTGTNAADYAVGTPADSPACGASTQTAPGEFCYFDVALTPSAAGPSSASVAIVSDAANAPTVNIALTAEAVADLRNPTQTAITITPPSGVVYPGSEQISVTVSAVNASDGTPTGSVVLSVTGHPKQTMPLVAGVATFTYNNLLGGTYNVVADYGGDGTAGSPPDFAVSAAKAKFTIVTATPALAVGAPIGSSKDVTVWAGNTYVSVLSKTTITASVTSTVGTPRGTVSFLQNGQPVDPTQVSIPLDANGNAVFATNNLKQGVYNLTVVYNGDVNYSSVSTPLPSFQVIVPSLQITASPASTTTKAGVPTQVTLTLKPLVGFVQDVNVQCVTATMPRYSECTFDNPEVSVGKQADPTAPSTIVVTISTNVPVNGVTSSYKAHPEPWSLAGIFGMGLLGLIAGRKRVNRYLTMVLVGLMLAGTIMGISACTNAGYSTPPLAPHVVTPPGTYQVQIITVNPQTGQQNSLATPVFILSTTVQ